MRPNPNRTAWFKLEIFNLSESRKFFRTEASWNLYSLKVRFELNVS